MMYPFMQLNDGTEIVHSEMLPEGKVKVYIEMPDEMTASTARSVFCPATNGRISAATENGKYSIFRASSSLPRTSLLNFRSMEDLKMPQVFKIGS